MKPNYEVLLNELQQNANTMEMPLAPNSKLSLLPAHLWAITRMQSFKTWFGDWQTKPKFCQFLDENGEPKLFYHGTKDRFEAFDSSKTVDGGFHFGSLKQAKMRAGKYGIIISAFLSATTIAKCKDTGDGWRKKINAVKKKGGDAIAYINRYEGLDTAVIDRLQRQGLLDALDEMSDAAFLKAVPESEKSFIIFDNEQILIVS